MKYVCTICGYIYDDEKEKVKFEDLPDTWRCPMCGAAKSDFKKLEDEPINNEPAKNQNTVVDEENEDNRFLQDSLRKFLENELAWMKQHMFTESSQTNHSHVTIHQYYITISNNKQANLRKLPIFSFS